MPLDIKGPNVDAAIKGTAREKPETTIGVHTTDAEGGTVKASVTSAGSWWSLSAWYQWVKGKGQSTGADAEFKF